MDSSTEMDSSSEVMSSTEFGSSTEPVDISNSTEPGDVSNTTDTGNTTTTTEPGEVGLYSGDGSQAANILNYVTIGISIVVLLAAIIYLQRKKK